MAPSRSSGSSPEKHEWERFADYRDRFQKCLKDHPIIERHDVQIETYSAGGETYVAVEGSVSCRNGVLLDISTYAECERRGKRSSRM